MRSSYDQGAVEFAQHQADDDGRDEYARDDPEQVHYLKAHTPSGTAIT